MANGAITSDKLSPNITDYSLNEVNTGAKWVDGSSIYKKTINFGALPDTGTKGIAHNIVDLDRIIKAEGMAKEVGGGIVQISIPHLGKNDGVKTYYNQTTVFIETMSNRSSQLAYIILYYTKS